MKRKHLKILSFSILLIILLLMLSFLKYRDLYGWGYDRAVSEREAECRNLFVETAVGWLGTTEKGGSHQAIIDIYNSHPPLAVGYEVQYDDAWCSTFVSTVSIQCNMTDMIPTECGCQRHIELFRELGCWEEADDYIPLPGDIIFYSWSGKRNEDCTLWADHIGIVVGTQSGFIKVIEGNRREAVAYRRIPVGHKYIRGFALPNYKECSHQNM